MGNYGYFNTNDIIFQSRIFVQNVFFFDGFPLDLFYEK